MHNLNTQNAGEWCLSTNKFMKNILTMEIRQYAPVQMRK